MGITATGKEIAEMITAVEAGKICLDMAREDNNHELIEKWYRWLARDYDKLIEAGIPVNNLYKKYITEE